MNKYEDLEVWQLAYELARRLYVDTRTFPRDERFGLTSQIRRSAISVASSIAEGAGRFTPGEFRNLVSVAGGSVLELDCQIRLAGDLGYLAAEAVRERRLACDRVGKMLYRLHQSLQA
jgi:carbamoyl-phosphate synthase large subunit